MRESTRLLLVTSALAVALTAPAASAAPLRDHPQAGTGSPGARAAAAGDSSLRYNGTIKRLVAPFAVAVNRYTRKIYVTEPTKNRVVVFDRLGRRRGAFGEAVLDRPTALAFDLSGNLAVLSAGAREIVLFRRGGTAILRARVPASLPLGLAFDPMSRRLLVTDAARDAVVTTRDGKAWTREAPAGLTTPVGAAAAGGHFFVVSSADTRLMELSATGALIRALPLRGARRPLGVSIPPSGDGLLVSSSASGQGLFGPQIGGPLEVFGGRGRMTEPSLPGSECTRAFFPDTSGNRVAVFDLPNSESCTQGLGLRGAVTTSGFRRIVAPVAAESDGKVSLSTRISIPGKRGPSKRYRLRTVRTSLAAGIEKKLRVKVPARAAAGIRQALRQGRRPTATLTFKVRNRAGDGRRVLGRLIYSAGAPRRRG